VEQVIDKRLSSNDKYEYLVTYKNYPKSCASWVSAKDIRNKNLILAFEEQRDQLMKEKRHLASWYPYTEQFVVQWKNLPFFIVPYGSGQLNNFCVVGLDKNGKFLKCKHVHNPNQPQHQVHVKLVQKEMAKLELHIGNKKFCSKEEMMTTENSEPSTNESIPKQRPISKKQINLNCSIAEGQMREGHFSSSHTIPTEFKPKSHPEFCQCQSDSKLYKSAPEPLNIAPILWLPLGRPVQDRKIFVWKCQRNNPKCDIFYDGHEDSIFNYSNKTLVSHVVLFKMLFSLLTG
jgi:hypothetical protein